MRRIIQLILYIVIILSPLPLYSQFKVNAAPIPPGVHLGGLPLSDVKEIETARAHLEQVYKTPVEVWFNDQRLVLKPEEIDFYIDADQMVAEASQYLEGPAFIDIAVRHALGIEQRQRDIPVRYMLNVEALKTWLNTIAADYNHEPQRPRAVTPDQRWVEETPVVVNIDATLPQGFVGTYRRDWLWVDGKPGYELDVEASILPLVQALISDTDRSTRLVLIETPPPIPSMTDLEEVLDNYLMNFPGFAAIYVHDLRHRQEAHVDTEVAFSGMSTLKIGIVTAVMTLIDGLPANSQASTELGQWMDFALGESNNYAANLLVQYLGDGSIPAGASQFTNFSRQLGLDSTYMQSGYDAQTQLPQIPTPGNQREDWQTNPDTNLQSTPLDMGRLLSAIYDCTQNTGFLIDTFGQGENPALTPEECHYILFYLSHDEFEELLWAGLPQPRDAWIAHKHGFAFESHSDVAIIWGPTGPYVVSAFLYRRGWLDWNTSNQAMKDLSRITWNFFEFQKAYLDAEETATWATPIELLVPPAYVRINASN
ncbi:MAG: serine hydrolase [Chloroflexota bacterium]